VGREKCSQAACKEDRMSKILDGKAVAQEIE